MKYFYKISIFLLCFQFIISCTNDKKNKEVIIVNESNINRTHIGVSGMTCVGCEVTLEHSISKMIGIVNVKASASKNEVVVEYDKSKINESDIEHEISNVGYEVYPLKNK